MGRRATRRRAAELLAGLDIEPPLEVGALCERLAEARGQAIELIPHSFPAPTVFGLWLGTADTDLIFYEADAPPGHQQHIVLHEIGHIVLGHGGPDDDSMWRDLLPNLAPDVVRTALRRSDYGSPVEQDAEMFASVILEWSSELHDLGRPSRTALERAFDEHRGWL